VLIWAAGALERTLDFCKHVTVSGILHVMWCAVISSCGFSTHPSCRAPDLSAATEKHRGFLVPHQAQDTATLSDDGVEQAEHRCAPHRRPLLICSWHCWQQQQQRTLCHMQLAWTTLQLSCIQSMVSFPF
jgi:hypothetical protein